MKNKNTREYFVWALYKNLIGRTGEFPISFEARLSMAERGTAIFEKKYGSINELFGDDPKEGGHE